MDIQKKTDKFIDKILKEEEKCLKTIEDPWIYEVDREGVKNIETSNPDIKVIDFADEWENVFRGILRVQDEGICVLFFNKGEINKYCKISQERAIEYLILCECYEIIEEWDFGMKLGNSFKKMKCLMKYLAINKW